MYHEAIRPNAVEERLHRDLRIFTNLMAGALVLDLYRQMIQVDKRQPTTPMDREATAFDTILVNYKQSASSAAASLASLPRDISLLPASSHNALCA